MLCLFIIFANSNSVHSYTLTNNQQMLLDYYENNLSSQYDSFFLLNTDELIVWNNPSNNKFYMSNGFWLCCEQQATISTLLYGVSNASVYLKSSILTFGQGNYHYAINNVNNILVGTSDVYTNNSFSTIGFSANYSPIISFIAPALYPNASQDQTPLTSGNFTFFIVNPGDVPETSSIQLDFFDTSPDNNGNPLVSEITLNKNSAFFQYSNIEETEYHYVITARFLDWFKLINGKSYRAVLAYYDNNNQYQSITYNWTMSISSSQQEIINQQTEQDISQGINDLNNSVNETNDFLKDNSYNQQGIINNMPSSDEYSDPASSGLLTIFNSLKNAFTSTSNEPVRFFIPFTNGNYIDIPPDLTISHVPQPILFIIRALYWYIICRYIVKDISNTANKAKSGELLDSKDGNIRTELL